MFCSSCGEVLPDGAAFCASCGKPANSTPAAETFSGAPTMASEQSASPALHPGELFDGRYEVEALLGEGGMGRVYRVRDRIAAKSICLKTVRAELVTSESIRQRFLREGVLARELRHPSIVSVYDVHDGGGTLYLTMEYLEGETLREWSAGLRRRHFELPLEAAIGIVRSALKGLAAAHTAGIIHRDLKPENLLLLGDPLRGDHRLKILDFGIARALESEVHLTHTGAAIGTPVYMAPEQGAGGENIGPAADLYSLAAIFYELLLEVPPSGRWELPSDVRENLPPQLDEFFRKALRTHPRRRFQSVDEFEAALGAIPAGPPTVAAPPPPPPPPPPTAPAESFAAGEERRIALPGCDQALVLRWCPPGEFTMGSPPSSRTAWHDERPPHKVVLSRGFHLGASPLTQAQWRAVMGDSPSRAQGPDLPVEDIDWGRALEFCERLGGLVGVRFRLPTEAEWEYACRAGEVDEPAPEFLAQRAWFEDNSDGRTHRVGRKRANAWGFLDMLGNVWEWCADWYGPYSRARERDPQGPPEGRERVLRGGAFGVEGWRCRPAARARRRPVVRGGDAGIRIALEGEYR